MFSNLPTTNFNFLVTLILSSANNWDKSEILSFGSELKDIFVWIQFSTSPVQKPKCITGAVYLTAYFSLSIFFYCASDSAHFPFSTEIPSRIRPMTSNLVSFGKPRVMGAIESLGCNTRHNLLTVNVPVTKMPSSNVLTNCLSK